MITLPPPGQSGGSLAGQKTGRIVLPKIQVPQAPKPSNEPSFVMKNFPGTMQTLAEIQKDPLSTETAKGGVSGFISKIGKALDISSAVSRFVKSQTANPFFKPVGLSGTPDVSTSPSDNIVQGLEQFNSAAGLAFSPVTSFLQAANHVPVLGTLSRLTALPFQIAGEAASGVVGKAVDSVPDSIMSPDMKQKFKPGLQEIGALLAQLRAGKALELTGKVGAEKFDSLIKKYGPDQTKTIIESAVKASEPAQLSEEVKQFQRLHDMLEAQREQKIIESRKGQKELDTQKLIGTSEPNRSAGEGFTISDKVSKTEVAKYKTYLEYNKSREALIKDPTSRAMERYLKAREKIFSYNQEAVQAAPQVQAQAPTPRITLPKPTEAALPKLVESRLSDQSPAGTPEGTRISKAAVDINKEAVRRGFEEILPEQLAKYDKITKEDQMKRAEEFITNDAQLARDMATGKAPYTAPVESQVLFNAIKNKAILERDVATLRELASSPLATERSVLAQKLGSSGYDNGLTADPVKAMQDIAAARKERASKRVKNVDKAVESTKEAIKKEIKKPTKQDWASFVESIKC